MLIRNSLEWAQKMFRKKVKGKYYAKFVFFRILHFFPLFFACNFFLTIVLSPFQRFGIRIKFCVFWIPHTNLYEKNLWFILAFFANFKCIYAPKKVHFHTFCKK
jgi:hypothetical protein